MCPQPLMSSVALLYYEPVLLEGNGCITTNPYVPQPLITGR
jgi:hypothetical protein